MRKALLSLIALAMAAVLPLISCSGVAQTDGGAVYRGTQKKTIAASGNTLEFTLYLSSLGTGGTGEASIAVELPGSSVTRMTVTVYTVADDGTIGTTPVNDADGNPINEKEIPSSGGKATFESGALPAGAYCAVFRLYGGDGTALLATWREFFGISGGATSTSTVSSKKTQDDTEQGKDIDSVYTITYEADGGTVTSAPRYFSRGTAVTAGDIAAEKEGYKKVKWYTDSALNTPFSGTAGMAADLTLYAKWSNGPSEEDLGTPLTLEATQDGTTVTFKNMAGPTPSATPCARRTAR